MQEPPVGAVFNRARVRGRLYLIGQMQMQEPPVGAVFNRAWMRGRGFKPRLRDACHQLQRGE